MPDHFLHGVEVIELDDGARPIQTVQSSVIGLVGTAPKGPVNKPTLILGSLSEAVKIFGEETPGFTIPTALRGIFQKVGAMVVVINVANPSETKLTTTNNGESRTFDEDDLINLGKYSVSNIVVEKLADNTSYAEGTDYSVDKENGVILRLKDGAIKEGETVSVSYFYLDPSKISMSEVVGGVNRDGTYNGVQCLLASQTEAKVQPRILIAPGFTSEKPDVEGEKVANPVVAELIAIAERLRAMVIADCPDGSKEDAVDYVEDWGSARLICAYPNSKVYNSKTDSFSNEPYSIRIAAAIAYTDNERGFWCSPSNTLLDGIVGLSKPIDFTLGDTNCLANFLNEKKIVTAIQEDGFRVWGNRTTSADPKWTFISVRRTADMINDSLLKAHLWAVDRNITKTYVEDVTEGVNNYLRYLKNIGAIIDGKCWADPTLNTPDQIEQGKITFDFDFCPPYPAEHITFRSRMTNNYLTEIFA